MVDNKRPIQYTQIVGRVGLVQFTFPLKVIVSRGQEQLISPNERKFSEGEGIIEGGR